MAVRDFIPEGEDLTGEEQARFDLRSQEGGILRPNDFVPDEDAQFVDRTPEEKEQFARDSAVASVARRDAAVAQEADRALKDRNEAQARDFMRNMSPADREQYLRAEKAGLNRQEIFDEFGEPESDEESGEGTIIEFGAIRAYTGTQRPVSELPLDTVSPSDRLHRAVRRRQAEGEAVEADSLSEHEERSVEDSDEGQHYPGDTDDDGIIEEPVVSPGNTLEDDSAQGAGGNTAAVNEAKARKAAAGDGTEPTLTPDDDHVDAEDVEEAETNPFRKENDETGGAAQTGPEQDAVRQGEEPEEPTEAPQPEAGGEKQGETKVTSEDVKAAKEVPEVQANKELVAEQKKAKAAAKKAAAKRKKEEE